jgi:hypothetical protein
VSDLFSFLLLSFPWSLLEGTLGSTSVSVSGDAGGSFSVGVLEGGSACKLARSDPGLRFGGPTAGAGAGVLMMEQGEEGLEPREQRYW